MTAGIAVLGAGAIAVTPVAPTLPEVQIPAIQLTATPPLTDWVDIFGTSFNNLVNIGEAWIDAPFPVIQQFLANQIGYGTTIFDSLTDLVGVYTPPLAGGGLEPVFDSLFSGDIGDAFTEFTQLARILGTDGYVAVQPMLDLPAAMLQNVTNVVASITNSGVASFDIGSLGWLGMLANSIPAASVFNAFGDALQPLVDDIANPLAEIQNIINIPAMLTDGFLNGSGPGLFGNASAGLTSFGLVDLGTIATMLIGLPQLFAEAIGWGGLADGMPLAAVDILSMLF
ncbi:hypothetical protein BHQ15_00580 [Mycolicibacillus koreensis]|nr:hypothetical protein BHQ15_00580 [Mycolicibacillus koreensis]